MVETAAKMKLHWHIIAGIAVGSGLLAAGMFGAHPFLLAGAFFAGVAFIVVSRS